MATVRSAPRSDSGVARGRDSTSDYKHAERGQSLVETAIFFTILLTMLAGVVQVGVAVNTYLIVINAAREGARYSVSSFDYTAQQIADVVQSAAYTLDLAPARATIIITRVQTSTSGGTPSLTSYQATTFLGSQASHFDQGSVLSRFGQGLQLNGTDEFIIVEFYYSMPMFIVAGSVPMYSYSIMRTVGN